MIPLPALSTFEQFPVAHLPGLIAASICSEWMNQYRAVAKTEGVDAHPEKILAACEAALPRERLDTLLLPFYRGPYTLNWPRYDVVDANALKTYPSARWHLDGGMPQTLKLFVYLNGVDAHGGNTLFLDRAQSDALRGTDVLPRFVEGRTDDVGPTLRAAGLNPDFIAFDLKTGDGLLFDPLSLAHRCLPPRPGTERHTICFTLTPPF